VTQSNRLSEADLAYGRQVRALRAAEKRRDEAIARIDDLIVRMPRLATVATAPLGRVAVDCDQ
jgi:hypothetical protein